MLLDKKIIYKRPFDDKEIEGRLVKSFTHTNPYWKESKNLGLIFYEDIISNGTFNRDITENVFKYIDINDERLTIYNESSIYPGDSIYELIKKYANIEYYIEDYLYNFVNYNTPKF